MAKTKVSKQFKKPNHVVERNITLLGNLMRYLLAKPELLSSLPDSFELVILPEDDPEIRQYNLELLDTYGSEGKPIVFARVESSQETDFSKNRPSLYVPVAA